jgi:FkbM family methyltransferase
MYLNHFLENNPALREATDESKQAVVQLWQPKSSPYGCRDRVLEDEWFKSVSEEDRKLLKWFNDICGGTYLEMGGLDGIRSSNTYVFHKGLDWKGVLVEASPRNYKKMVQNRPNEIANVHAAVCEKRMDLHWVEVDRPTVGGILEFAAESFKDRWWSDADIQNAEKIQCIPLKDLLDEQVGKHFFFDFFSLDIEGAEYEALASLDFNSVAFGVILVEALGYNEKKNLAVRTFLESNGYIFLGLTNRSYWFVNGGFANVYKDLLHV